MVDRISQEIRKKTMQAIRSKNSDLEANVSKYLWHKGLRFRRNVRNLPGTPDIAIKKYKVVIFIDSCFWHGCPIHCRLPSSNREYWLPKIERNRKRDKDITRYYEERGWHILRVWEHQFKEKQDQALNEIIELINKAMQ